MNNIEKQLFAHAHLRFKRQPADDSKRKGCCPQAQSVKYNKKDSKQNISVYSAKPKGKRKYKIYTVYQAKQYRFDNF